MKNSSFTRRDFLKTASATVAGGMLFSSLPGISRAAPGPVAGSDILKIAVIGCGGRGTGATSQALNTGNVKLVAMADTFQADLDASLKKLAAQHPGQVDVPPEHQFVGLDAYKKAIALADVVILTTPPGFRPRHFEEAVRAGKHVFMEKPVAVDAPGIRTVLAAAAEAKKKNLKVGVGLQRHHDAGYIETIKRLQDGVIGDLTSMRCYWNSGGVWVHPRQPEWSELEYQIHNWYYFTWICGDHILEQHIHNIDVINWVKGAYPIRAQGQGGRQVRTGPDHGQIFDHHFVEFEYADGSRLYSQCRHQPGWNTVSEHAQGTKGKVDISRHVIEGADTWRFRGDKANPYQVEHNDLFNAIRNDTPYNEAVRGAKSTMTAILGRMCTYSNEEITWDQAMASNLDLAPDDLTWDSTPPVVPDANGGYPVPEPGKTVAL